jgi:hypothetical protein
MVENSVYQCNSIDYIHSGGESASDTEISASKNSPIIEEFINGMSHEIPEQKRKRKRDSGVKTTGALGLETFSQVIAAQCLSGIDPDFDFQAWADSNSAADARIKELGYMRNVILPAFLAYSKPIIDLVESNRDLAKVAPAQSEYIQLGKLFQQVLITHEFTLDTKFDRSGKVCFVTQQVPKGDQRLVLIILKQHEPQESADEPLSVHPGAAPYPISVKYAEICFAVWYLLSLPFLIGGNMWEWVMVMEKREPGFRAKFADGGNGALVEEFMKARKKEIEQVYENVQFYLGIVNRETKSRKTKCSKIKREMEKR